MLLWLVYSVTVGLLVVAAAVLAEHAALRLNVATRHVWLVAMVLVVVASFGGLAAGLRPRGALVATASLGDPLATAAQGTAPVFASSSRAATGAAEARVDRIDRGMDALTTRLSPYDRGVATVWCLLTVFVAGLVLHAIFEGRRLLHACEARRMHGVRVLVTDNLGPAAVGIGAAAVLLPRWALDLEEQLLDLVVRHEREHLDANDPGVLLAGLALIVLLPWHLPLWWAWQRLRLAIEVDCDARLLRETPHTARYAQLLMLLSQRVSRPSAAMQPFITVAAPLHPERSHLARRIRIMTQPIRHRSIAGVWLIVLGVAATGTIAVALPVPRAALRSANAPVAADGRTLVRVTSVGLRGVEVDEAGKLKGEVLLFAEGAARVAIGNGAMRSLDDTLHLRTLPAFTADVTEGGVHVRLMGSARGSIVLGATVTGGPTVQLSGRASHLVLERGGTGIRPVVDDAARRADAETRPPQRPIPLFETRVVAGPTAQDTGKVYLEFQVEEAVRTAPGSAAPRYPTAEKAAGKEGQVLAQFIVNTDGRAQENSFRVLSGTIMRADGKKEAVFKADNDFGPFEIAVRDALPGMRFEPAKIKGVRVRQLVQQPFVFAIEKKKP